MPSVLQEDRQSLFGRLQMILFQESMQRRPSLVQIVARALDRNGRNSNSLEHGGTAIEDGDDAVLTSH